MVVPFALGDDSTMPAADLLESCLLKGAERGGVPGEGDEHHVVEAENVEGPIKRQPCRFCSKALVLLRDDDAEFSGSRDGVDTDQQGCPNRLQRIEAVDSEMYFGRASVDRCPYQVSIDSNVGTSSLARK